MVVMENQAASKLTTQTKEQSAVDYAPGTIALRFCTTLDILMACQRGGTRSASSVPTVVMLVDHAAVAGWHGHMLDLHTAMP